MSFEERITCISKDKYPSIFWSQMEAIALISGVVSIFFWKIGEHINNSRHTRIFVRGHYMFREANS